MITHKLIFAKHFFENFFIFLQSILEIIFLC
ncbi:Hypothetical Protein MfeM64YM_0743 [Mycoplasmopsis fermentans M64]|uniref:Uncharacterized protein n=1 Tax=Mycoplasmopsis fermentans (strain M64) TaxID=943945 RepID=A0AB32XCF0_MYCFM|nr:Hypothetical Protein MfeM64YM_0743 [Mycoplasmopsis fermentans M64]